MPPVEIQWCDHSTVLLEYLRQLYEEGRFVDVGLECEGRQVKAHKAVISACSPYLEGLLKGNPARSHLIKFNGYSYSSLHAVIDFMYNGTVLVEQENLAAFLKLGRALQVRGILDIASQCEDAGLTTAEETKSNAQYSTTVQQSQKQPVQAAQAVAKQGLAASETKKYAFMLDKQQSPKKQTQPPQVVRKTSEQTKVQQVQQIRQQQIQEQQQQQLQQEQQQQQQQVQASTQLHVADGAEVDSSTLEELQQALSSGQALLHADGTSGEHSLQMMEGQCVVTGSGQTYVVVQEGDNISFVPAEMVQGDLSAAVNGQQVMEGLETVEQQLAQIEGQEETEGEQAVETAGLEADDTATTAQDQLVTSSEGEATAGQLEAAVEASEEEAGGAHGGDTLETMSVVESLVKLGEKQPETAVQAGVEVGPDMPSLEDAKVEEAGKELEEAMEEEEHKVGEMEEEVNAEEEGGEVGERRRSAEWSQQGVAKKPKL